VLLPGVKRIGVLLWILGFAAAPAGAAPEDWEGRTVQAVGFEPATQPYPRDYLLGILPVRIGQPLQLAGVRAAIERLYRTGRYADIRVDAREAPGGVALTFITRGNFFVGRVSVSGVSQPPADGVLVNATRLELGTLYTNAATAEAVNNLEQALRTNGFYTTHIVPEYHYDPVTQQVAIHFNIETGERARLTTPVLTGTPERKPAEILKTTHWKGWFGWKTATGARTQDGVQRVRRTYQKRERLEARVSLDKMDWNRDTNRVEPTLNIEAGPKISVITTGAKISRGRLKQLVPVFEEQSVDRDLLVEGAANIREYLEGQGYFHAKVEFETRSVDGAAAPRNIIEYRIARGERHKVASVTIAGNRYFDTNTIRERMYIRPASLVQFRHGRFSEAFLKQDAEAIAALYRANGFRDVEVTPRVDHGSTGKQNDIAIYIGIKEGPQWLVEGLTIEGSSEANREAVLGLVQSQQGQPFSDINVAIDRDNILDYYYNQGHIGATFAWSFAAAPQPNRVSLKYTVTEGRQRFLREFLVSGLEATDAKLVRERLTLDPGDPLSRGQMLETQRRLYDLGVFARVDMAIQNPGGEEAAKYVLVDAEEARKYTFTTGFGAEVAKIGGCRSCLDSPQGAAGFSPRASFGVTRRNFLGEGHIVSFQSRVSTLQQRGVLSYEAPQFRGNNNVSLLFSGVFDDSRDVRTFSSRRREVSAQVGQKVSKASTMLYRFSYRRVSVTDLIVSPELIPLYSQPARIGMASTNYIEDRRDDPSDAHRGVFNTLDAGWASKYFASQSDFTHLLARNSTYHSFGLGGRYVLARTLTLGWLQPLRAGADIPLSERFFGGGAQSHRGFPENQAGIRDLETGFPLGGKAILINQTELRFPAMGDNMGGVLFWDAGNVYSRLQALSFRQSQRDLKDFDYMVHAVGLGVRYRTPVGPVRFDVAWSINPPKFYGFKGTYDELVSCSSATPPTTGCVKTVQRISHFQFHFSLGQAF
jgi:outer membrane protein assembly complex protein YaeT